MKKIFTYIVTLLIFIVCSSYVLLSYTRKNTNKYVTFYITHPLRNYFVLTGFSSNTFETVSNWGPEFKNALETGDPESILGSGIRFTAASAFHLNNANNFNTINEAGVGSNPDSDAAMYTHSLHSGGKIIASDIMVNTNFTGIKRWSSKTWQEPYGNLPAGTYCGGGKCKFDRSTAFRHEVGHALGLDHTLSSVLALMYRTMQLGKRKGYDGDYKAGLDCIFNNKCNPYTGGFGSIDFDCSIEQFDNKETFTWVYNEKMNFIVGFNVLIKNQDSDNLSLESLNTKMIFQNGSEEYSFETPVKENSKYVLELVHENGISEFKNLN